MSDRGTIVIHLDELHRLSPCTPEHFPLRVFIILAHDLCASSSCEATCNISPSGLIIS